jgi:hypothetical protein
LLKKGVSLSFSHLNKKLKICNSIVIDSTESTLLPFLASNMWWWKRCIPLYPLIVLLRTDAWHSCSARCVSYYYSKPRNACTSSSFLTCFLLVAALMLTPITTQLFS